MLSNVAHHWSNCGPTISHSTVWIWFSQSETGPGVYIVSNVSEEQSALLCVSVPLQAVSEYRKQRESHGLLCDPRERMFPLFMLRRIHLSVTLKWPWLGSFQPSRFTSLNETPGNIFRLQWGREEGLDKMLQRYRERQTGRVKEKSARERQICYSCITHTQNPPVIRVCVCINLCSWWFLSVSLGISSY